jgi:acetyl esterase/lipase
LQKEGIVPRFKSVLGRKIKPVFAAVLFCSVFPGWTGNAFAQANNLTVTGTVTDPAGKPVAGATVSLVGRSLSVKTDANGKYALVYGATALNGIGGIGADAQGSREPLLILREGGIRFRAPAGDRERAGGFYSPTGRWIAPAGPGEAATGGHAPLALAKAASENAASAAPDSIDVLAIGFQREGRGLASLSGTQDFKLKALSYNAVPYKTGADLSLYEKQRCFLDVHVPAGPVKKHPVIVHLHGGGLQGGDKVEGWSASDKNNYVRKLSDQGFILVCVNYRLGIDPDLPDKGGLRGKYPDYLKDAAASIAWTKRNIEPYGGDTANFFVMGYSAGAWLSLMMVMDTTYYKEAGFDQKAVNGYICLSAQTYTYGEYAIEQNISDRGISVAAALKYVRKIDAPVHLFVGGLETQRLSDNNVFLKQMKDAGTASIQLSVMPGRDHETLVSSIGNAVDDTRTRILEYIKSRTVPSVAP